MSGAKRGTEAEKVLPPIDSIEIRAGVIRALRRASFWSQKELSERSGVSVPTIQRLEAGGPARLRTVGKLAKAFDIQPHKLVKVGGVDLAE